MKVNYQANGGFFVGVAALGLLIFVSCQPSKSLPTDNVVALQSIEDTTVVNGIDEWLKVSNERFPQDWAGIWEGKLRAFSYSGMRFEISMGLNIMPLDSGRYSFTIIYGEGEERQERPYEIYAVDSTGHFITDEKNSILLDEYVINNKLFSRFDVSGNLLLISYEKRGEKMLFEVVFGNTTPISTSGGQDSIPSVNSYPVTTLQRGVLYRQKN